MGKFYEDLKESFEDILAYRKKKITLRSEKIKLPEPPSDHFTIDAKLVRNTMTPLIISKISPDQNKKFSD
jgi:hypothetical protein